MMAHIVLTRFSSSDDPMAFTPTWRQVVEYADEVVLDYPDEEQDLQRVCMLGRDP